MKLIEKLWLMLVIITLVSAIPSLVYYPFHTHGKTWAIIFAAEMMITVLYNILFKRHYQKPRN